MTPARRTLLWSLAIAVSAAWPSIAPAQWHTAEIAKWWPIIKSAGLKAE